MEAAVLLKRFQNIVLKDKHTGNYGDQLAALNREWELERIFNFESALFIISGILLSSSNPRWKWMALLSAGFLLEKGFRGKSIVYKLINMFGFRTKTEIEHEKYIIQSKIEALEKEEWARALNNDGCTKAIFEVCI